MRGLRTVQSRNGRRSRPQVFGTRFEALERRELLATFTVTNSGDLTSTGAVVPGSLRDAINRANLNPGADLITFNIGGGGVHTIVVSPAPQPTPLPLPPINDSVTIDATTQPGFGGTPLIYISGVDAGNAANGLQIDASNTTIKGLGIENFAQAGVRIEAGGVTLLGNFIGVDSSGSIARPNSGPGVVVDGQADCQIGGTNPGDANVISGNRGSGVQLISGSVNNTIEDNFIGASLSGGSAVPNGGSGVQISGSSFNNIGGPGIIGSLGRLISQGNIISGNSGSGVVIFGQGSSGNTVQGNTIGLNSSGASRVPNQGDGVDVLGSARNLIGGLSQSSGNLISGNQGAGLNLISALGTSIQGNLIGTDASGVSNEGNAGAGITLSASDGSVIGGSQTDMANTIAFNGLSTSSGGVEIQSGASVPILGNSIFGNGRLGINLIVTGDPANGVTQNHAGGGIPGEPNNAENYPVLSSAVTGAGRTLIQGTFNAAANASYTIQFFSNTTADVTGFGQGQKLIGQTALTTDSSGNATINLTLPTPSTVGQFISATATDSQNDTSEFCHDVTINAANIADTGLQVVASPSPATLGGDITYTLTVDNNGPSPATGVTVTDFFPTSTNFVSAAASQGTPPVQNPGSVVVNLGTIAPGGTATVTVVVSTTATGVVTNTATVSSNEIDPNTQDNSVVTTTPVNIPADVAVTMTTDPSPSVTVGSQLAYTIIVTNNGPGTATNVTVTDPLPAGVTILSADSGQGSSVISGSNVTTFLGSLPSGVSSAIRIVVQPTDVGTLVNTATATLDEIDPDLTNNSATTTTTVIASVDLQLGMTADPEPVLVGQNLTYVVTVTNNGPSAATGVTVTDLLPADVNFVSATASQGAVSSGTGSVVANLGDLGFQASATITIVVVPTRSETITNEATVKGNEFDPNANNNAASIDSTVSPADVGVSIQANPSPVLANGNLTYTLLVTNNGPATADNVSLVDQLPAGVIFVSAVAAQGTATPVGSPVSQVDFSLGSIASGATVAATIVVVPTAPGSLTNSASVSADEFDPNTANNSASIVTLVSPVDLSVSTTPSTSSLLFGGNLTYTINVTNGGPATATNVVLTDTLPAGATYVSGTTTQGQVLPEGATVLVPIGILAPGATATITLVVTPTSVGTAVNTAVVTSDQTDTNPADNVAVTVTNVFNLPGEFDFSSTSYSALQSAGAVQITVVRDGGSLGAASVGLNVTGITARPGIDFVPTTRVLDFADGQISQTVTLTLLDDGQHGPDRTILLTLSAPSDGVPLGPQSSATLTIVNVHPDLVGPVVTGTQLIGSGSILGIAIGFSKALDPATANNINNYAIASSNGKQVAIRSVSYNPLTNVVTITPMKALKTGSFYVLRVNGSAPNGIRDTVPAHNLLNGAGIDGTDLIETFIRSSSIRYIDANNNAVSFKLSGGGTLDLVRSASGQGLTLTIVNPRAFRSVLSGSVKPGRLTGSGVTTLQSITGLVPFGSVRSTLTQPPFVVGNEPSFAAGAISTPAIDRLLSTGRLRAARLTAARRHH